MISERDAFRSAGPDRYILDDYWTAVYRRRWIVVLVTGAAITLAVMISQKLPPRYEALAEFYVPQDIVGAAAGALSGDARVPGVKELSVMYADLLRGRDAQQEIAARIAAKFPERYGEPTPDDPELPQKRAMADLSRNVDQVVSPSGSVRIYARARVPEIAAAIANTFVTYFDDFHDGLITNEIDHSLERLGQQLVVVEEKWEEAQDRVRAYMEEHRIASMATEQIDLESARSSLESQLRTADVDLAVARQRISSLETQLELEDDAYRAGAILVGQSGVVSVLQQRLAEVEADLAARLTELKPSHPDIVALQRQQESITASLAQEITKVVNSQSKLPGSIYEDLRRQLSAAHVDFAAGEARYIGLREALEEVNDGIVTLPAKVLDLERLQQVVSRHQQFMANLVGQQQGLEAQKLRQSEIVVVTALARPPTRPVFPILAINVLVSAIAGVVVGVLYALFLDYLANRKRILKLRKLQQREWVRTLYNELVTPEASK